MNHTLLAACVQAAAALVVAHGRVSRTDETTVRLQVMEMALDLYAEAHSRSRSPMTAMKLGILPPSRRED